MSMMRRLGLAALIVVCGPWTTSQVHAHGYGHCCHHGCGWGFGGLGGFGLGLGLGYGLGYGTGFYRPYPVYVAPAPVVVQQPVYVQQPVVAQPAYPPSAPPPAQAPAPLPPPTPVPSVAAPSAPDVLPAVATGNGAADLDSYVRQLRSGDEQTRADALIRLGKMQAERAVGPMVKALHSDASPRVREAAARGLGLIASPSSLAALQYAAQADDDREVRHSASFAAETIRGNLRR